MALNEAAVEGTGIFGVKKCFLQFSLRAEKESAIHLNHPILPTFLDDLTVDANPGQQPLCCPFIHLKSVGGEEESVLNTAALQGGEDHFLDVSEVATANRPVSSALPRLRVLDVLSSTAPGQKPRTP